MRASFCSFLRRCAGTAAARNRNEGVNGVGTGVVILVAEALRDLLWLFADEGFVDDNEDSPGKVSPMVIGSALS